MKQVMLIIYTDLISVESLDFDFRKSFKFTEIAKAFETAQSFGHDEPIELLINNAVSCTSWIYCYSTPKGIKGEV